MKFQTILSDSFGRNSMNLLKRFSHYESEYVLLRAVNYFDLFAFRPSTMRRIRDAKRTEWKLYEFHELF